MIKSVLDYLELSAETYSEKTAVTDENGSLSYACLLASCRSIGTYLAGKELKADTPVVVFMDKCKEAPASFWGITYAGGIYVPLDVHAPVARLKLIIDVCDPAYVITDKEHFEKACELVSKERVLDYDDIVGTPADEDLLARIQSRRIDTDPLYIIFTSGSTGVPKGVVIPHRAVIDFTEEASEVMEFSDKESFANQAPFYFDASVPDLYCTIRNGATLHIIPASWYVFPINVLKYIKEHEINAIFWVPSALIVAANLKAVKEVDVTCLKKIMFCGEVMPVKQYNIWKSCVPDAKYVNYYGPSETTYASTYYVIDREFDNSEFLPIGRPAINTGVVILSYDNKECADGEVGELCIRGSSLALGYYNNPEKTKEAFVQNPLSTSYNDLIYRTGDLVKVNSLGEIEYVSRKDFQIKHMGYRIELGEIENAAISVSGVKRTCCVYNDKRKQIVLLFEGSASEEEVKAGTEEKVPEYMVPGKIVKLDSLPMNANDKIDRVKLKEQYG